MSHKKGTRRKVLPNWAAFIAIVAVIVIAVIAGFTQRRTDKKPGAVVHSCEEWEKIYPVIAGNAFPLDTVRLVGRDRKVRLVVSRTLYVRRGEAWLIRLSPTDTTGTGWVKFDPTAPKNWSLPGQRVWMIYPDGIRVEDAPGKIIRTSGRNVRRFLGEGCVLVRAAS